MAAVRAWLFYLFIAVTIIPTCIWLWISKPFLDEKVRFSHAQWLARKWLEMCRTLCGIDWKVSGMENLEGLPQPCIIACKHQSAWETLWVAGFCGRPISFVYKKELHWLPFFGWALASFGLMSIDRKAGNGFASISRKAPGFFGRGWSVAFFPEGTRTAPGAVNPRYKTGAARLAVQQGVPIVPIALAPGHLWPRNSVAKKPGTVPIVVGKPIPSQGRQPEDLTLEVGSWIEARMREIAPDDYTTKKTAS